MKTKKNELNDYSGSEWAKASLSVQKFNGRAPNKRKEHGAAFPFTLAKHFILTYSKKNELIFDPFVGVGTTTDAAYLLGRKSIGMDINKKFVTIAKKGPDSIDFEHIDPSQKPKKLHKSEIIADDSTNLKKYVKKNSVKLILTSPPYGNLLRIIRPKFADKMLFTDTKNKKTKQDRSIKNPQAYSKKKDDIGNMTYSDYLGKLETVFEDTLHVAKDGAYAIWVVKDYRDIKNKSPYVNLHGDIIDVAQNAGWKLWDIVIWDQAERRPLVVLGYPSKNFYANIGHSFIVILKKQ